MKNYKSDIETLKKWIVFILLNKGILFSFFIILLFIFYVILKKYVKKKTSSSFDIENQHLNNHNNENFDLAKEFEEFQKIVSATLNLNVS